MNLINGFWWPDHDKDCHPVILHQSRDIEKVLTYVSDFSACIQAGGNVGVWAKTLAQKFGYVYTFEPDPENFECLVRNVPETNVVKLQAAVGVDRGLVVVKPPDEAHKNNCGAYQVFKNGFVPTLRIDDLALSSCGLIYLDVEGYELFALDGAIATIQQCRPVIAFEDKNLPMKYGVDLGEPEKFLETFGYEVAERIHRDVICVPSS